MSDQLAVLHQRAAAVYHAAWCMPRWGFHHGKNSTLIVLPPATSMAIDAGSTAVALGDMTAKVLNRGTALAVDGNVHSLLRMMRPARESITIAKGYTSAHVNVGNFLTEMHVAVGIEPERIFVHIAAGGDIDVALAPSVAWVDPLVRRCRMDCICAQNFLLKYRIGGVPMATLHRLFGTYSYTQDPEGTADALAPFLAPVILMQDGVPLARAFYHNTVAELLDTLPPAPVYLHGVQLRRCSVCLWELSPRSHGVIDLCAAPPADTETRTIMGGDVQLPRGHDVPAFVPCAFSITANAFAPALRHMPQQLAALAPPIPTALFLAQLTQGEPMTISLAQCIFRHLSAHYVPEVLRDVLISMALPTQHDAMAIALGAQSRLPVHISFETYVAGVALSLR